MKTIKQQTAYCRPDRAQYRTGEPIRLLLFPESDFPTVTSVRVFRLQQELDLVWTLENGAILIGTWESGNYGVAIERKTACLRRRLMWWNPQNR